MSIDRSEREDRKLYIMGDPFPGPWWTWKQFGEWVQKFTELNQNQIGRHTGKMSKATKKKIPFQVIKKEH